MSEFLEMYRIQAEFYTWDDARLVRAIEEASQERKKRLAELENSEPMQALSKINAIDRLRDAMAKMLCEHDRRRLALRTTKG